MSAAGREPIARWREAGEWWSNEAYREVTRFIDHKGVLREESLQLPTLGALAYSAGEMVEDHTEDLSLKTKKIRDEKVTLANARNYESYRASMKWDKKRASFVAESPTSSPASPVTPHGRSSTSEALKPGNPLAESNGRRNNSYTPLHCISGYAFGRSSVLADEIPLLCAHVGIEAACISDPFSLVGAVEFSRAAKKAGIKPLIGASFELPEGGEIVLIARSKVGYQNLSQLITLCHLEEPRLFPLCTWERLERHSRDLICLTGGHSGPLNRLMIRRDFSRAKEMLRRLIGIYGSSNVSVEIERSYMPWEISVNKNLIDLADEHSLLAVAGGQVTHARREHYPVQDILVCAETLCTVDEIVGRKAQRHESQPQIAHWPERSLNAERFLHTPLEMNELFSDIPQLLENTKIIAGRCDDEVLPSRTQLPEIFCDSNHALREITMAGALLRYPKIPLKLRRRIEHELERITRLNFAGHFLVSWDACRWASDQNILFSGRGSVVDSVVGYCLGFNRIDAFAHNLHFDRFLPEDGSKRPDIDIDFEAKHRDAVRNYMVRKYGEDRVGTVAAVGAYCTRGIIREVGKALGLPSELIGFLAKRIHGGVSPEHLEAALEKRPELRGSSVPRERFGWVFRLAERLTDIPRNMRAHSSGVVISSMPLAETVPVMWSASPGDSNREDPHLRIIQWDKRSAKHYFDKFDILCLRGQDVLSGTQERIRLNEKDFNVQKLPLDDKETYSAMRSGELIGIPQSASPAMRQAHIRIRTSDLHDASLVQAGIRPGVGGAVKLNELIARRRGNVQYTFSHPELERILGITYGITVFQEQVDQLLQSFCGFSSGEAEDTRESIHARRREDYGKQIKDALIRRMISRGHSPPLAEEVFELIAGFKGYGFAQGHALAFAEISIRSIYCQQNFPAEYFSALLSAQPAGYYGPCTLVNEARSRGVAVLPVDVNASLEEFTVEDVKSTMDPKIVLPGGAIRVGLSQVNGLSETVRKRCVSFSIQEVDRDLFPAGPTPASTLGDAEGQVGDRHLQAEAHKRDAHARDAHGTGLLEKVVASSYGSAQATPVNGKRFRSFFDFVAKVQPERDDLELLVLCGALDSLHPNRRALLWAIPAAQDYAKSVADPGTLPLEMPEPELPRGIQDMNDMEKAIHERRILDLDVAQHLMSFERERVASKGGITTEKARRLPHGKKAIVVGNPIRLRFPPTPSGKRVVFFDLEDETGLLNVTVFDDVYQRDGHAIVCSPYITIIGEAQDRDGHTAFLANRVFPYSPVIARNAEPLPVTTADFLTA